MRVLMSVYACAPGLGSEHAVGWNWATEAHRLGHEVWALGSPAHREAVEAACRSDPRLAGMKWLFPDVGLWPLSPGRDAKWERSHNLLWQIAALRLVRRLTRIVQFDVVHHLTWAGIRAPTFLGSLGVPLIIGPIGGGETSPLTLRRDLRLKAQITEWIRDMSNATIALNPIVRGGLKAASLIFVKTPETQAILPRAMQKKTRRFTELTITETQIGKSRTERQDPPRLLVVGRLLYWKGTNIALSAFDQVISRIPDARLTIIGHGPEEARLKAQIMRSGLESRVELISWQKQSQLFQLYESHDLLVFPSLHDSGGTVVLEALSHGLPVICLDLGGPPQIICANAGIVVSTQKRTMKQVAAAMAEEIIALFADRQHVARLSEGAIKRSMQFIASNQIAEFYANLPILLEEQLKHPAYRVVNRLKSPSPSVL